MIRLTRCTQASKAGTYFRLHLQPGDNQANPSLPAAFLRAGWIGNGLADVSLAPYSLPQAAQLVRLGRGLHPISKARLAPDVNRKRAYYDLTISPPKTISLAALLFPSHPGAQSVLEAHTAAVTHVAYVASTMLAPQRQGHPATKKWIGALFHHTHTREGDPHLHSHVILPNLMQNVKGQWRAMQVNIAGVNRTKLEVAYGAHLTRSLRRIGMGDDLLMRNNGTPELRSLLPLVPRFSTATRAVLSAAKAADAKQPTRVAKAGIHAGQIHPRSGLVVPSNDLALKRRRRLADQIRRPKPKDADNPVRLSNEADRWKMALDNQEARALIRLLDLADITNPHRKRMPVKVLDQLPPSAAVVVRAAWERMVFGQKANMATLMRLATAESAGRHDYQELREACKESLQANRAAVAKVRGRLAAEADERMRAKIRVRIAATSSGDKARVPEPLPSPAATPAAPLPTNPRWGRRR